MNLSEIPTPTLIAEIDRRRAEMKTLLRKSNKLRGLPIWARRAEEVRNWLGIKQDEAAMYGECSQANVSMCEAGMRPNGAKKLTMKLVENGIVNRTPGLEGMRRR